jgi:hypothetical protein
LEIISKCDSNGGTYALEMVMFVVSHIVDPERKIRKKDV